METIQSLAGQGFSASKIAKQLGVPFQEVVAACSEQGIELQRGVSQQEKDASRRQLYTFNVSRDGSCYEEGLRRATTECVAKGIRAATATEAVAAYLKTLPEDHYDRLLATQGLITATPGDVETAVVWLQAAQLLGGWKNAGR